MRLPLLMLMMLASGCVTAPATSGDALCNNTRTARADHAQALAVTPDDAVAVTGARLVGLIDAGCKA